MNQLPKLIGLSGYAQSGKDTVASILVREFGYERIAFADPIKEFVYRVSPTIKSAVDEVGWEEAKTMQYTREMLQNVGIAARDIIHPNIWIDLALAKAKHEHRVVITDVRFKNEAQMITIAGGELWRVHRKFTGPVNDHISETELDNHPFDRHIFNDAGLNGLTQDVYQIIYSIRHAGITAV